MGRYEIVIAKQDGEIKDECKEFAVLGCLKFLEKLKLGAIPEEEFKANEPLQVHSLLECHTIQAENKCSTRWANEQAVNRSFHIPPSRECSSHFSGNHHSSTGMLPGTNQSLSSLYKRRSLA